MSSQISFGSLNSGTQVANNYGTINTSLHPSRDLDERLPMVHEALLDSFDNRDEDVCLPGTRTEILRQLNEWGSSQQGKRIFWLNGMAGTGKSTISRTIAKSFKEAKLLGANFFFKRGEGDRGNAMKLFPTIARQLAMRVPQLATGVQSALAEDPGIAKKALKEQFDKLIYRPLLSLPSSGSPVQTLVIVIDALDECERQSDIRLILRLLPQLQKSTTITLKIFLTSRPETPIRLGFKEHDDHQGIILHEIPIPIVELDIRLFLKHRLNSIGKDKGLEGWPTVDTIEALVGMAVPLFIFAETVCRFVERGRHAERLLQRFLNSQATTSATQMDQFYLPILEQLIDNCDEKEIEELLIEFRDVVGTIVVLATPLPVDSLSSLLGIERRQITELLDPLYSVLSIPTHRNTPVRILHLSFRDYLLNTERAFHVDEADAHHRTALYCLRVMGKLKKNICNLSSYGMLRTEVDDRALDYIPADLQYSCRYWVYHLTQSESRVPEQLVLSFLRTHFLHWLEALSLIGAISDALSMISALQSTIPHGDSSGFSDFLYDAKRFILRNKQIAEVAPLQLYAAGLIFVPSRSTVRNLFQKDKCKRIHTHTGMEWLWSAHLQTLEGHSGPTTSVAFSPDGQTLISGSEDCSIKIWDTNTGQERLSLGSHSRHVSSIAFSPDGQTVASGSHDSTIKLWNVTTGEEKLTLKGHASLVLSVAFTPDGQTVASGSDEGAIKLWNSQTGEEQLNINGHSSLVRSVTFSPDGQLLASGSKDQTLKIWDVKTGGEKVSLQGFAGYDISVAFSPDGQTLASGSKKEILKLWDINSGMERLSIKCPGGIYSVVFSPDGQRLASCSWGGIINLWDVNTGKEYMTIYGHYITATSVAFSPNGQTLASTSTDCTVKLWDVDIRSQRPIEEHMFFKEHSDFVSSVSISPDGQRVASSMPDYKIKLSDTWTGQDQILLMGHSGPVSSMKFSPDNQMLGSGSRDNTLKLWDINTGQEKFTLTGHTSNVHSVTFSRDGQVVGSRSDNLVHKVWDTTTGEELLSTESYSDWAHAVGLSAAKETPVCQVSMENNWVVFKSERLLWLPTEYRSYSDLAYSNNTVVLGYNNGRVLIVNCE